MTFDTSYTLFRAISSIERTNPAGIRASSTSVNWISRLKIHSVPITASITLQVSDDAAKETGFRTGIAFKLFGILIE